MSNAEHLIENAILALSRHQDLDECLAERHNAIMLEKSGIQKDDIIRMACHVVYSLYDGKFPSEFTEELKDGITQVTSLISFYDQEETYPDCTVQVLTNTETGAVSVGWRRNDVDYESDMEWFDC